MQDLLNFWRIATDKHHSPGVMQNGFTQRAEILALAITTSNQYHFLRLALLEHATDGRAGRTHIGAFGIIVKIHVIDIRYPLHAVRQTSKRLHGVQDRHFVDTNRLRQCNGRQGVGNVMFAANLQAVRFNVMTIACT